MSPAHWFIMLWCASGVLGLWLGTPPWIRRNDPFGFSILHSLACIGGVLYLVMGLIAIVMGRGINERDYQP